MNYEEALGYLDSLTKFGIKFGLERIAILSERFGNPHKRLKTIHVGGTNGKGSTSTFISSILSHSGLCVGTYLSPYVNDPRERIQIDGKMISKDDFAQIITQIAPVADEIGKSDLGEVTEFEAKTMAAFLYFSQQQVDIAVLEVGMGGRYDATNLVHPMAAVITNVTLDHMERLGDTVAAIAREKAGIIKPSCTVITCAQDPDAIHVISDKCARTGAELWRVSLAGTDPINPQGDFSVQYVHNEGALSVRGSDWAIGGLCPSLKGDFQYANAAAAVAAVMSLERFDIRVSPSAIFSGISEAYIPGRLEVLQDNPLLVLDGAHNPDAALNLAQTLPNTFGYRRMIMVIGMLDNHAPDGVMSHLAVMATKVIATQSTWFKARKADEIAKSARNYCSDVESIASVPKAVQRALQVANPDDLILVTGSFYTIGEVPRPAA